MDAVIAEIRTAVPAIPAGDLGAERGLRQGTNLSDEEFPHLFVHSAEDTIQQLDYGQELEVLVFAADLWTRGLDQEAVEVLRDAIRARVDANPTLTALVDRWTISASQHIEAPGKSEHVLRLEVLSSKLVASVVSFELTVQMALTGSAASVLTALAAALDTTTGGSRLTSDYRTLEAIPSGATRYQLAGAVAEADEQLSSNEVYEILTCQLRVHHRPAGAERTYTEGAMLTMLAALTQSNYWRVAGVFSIVEPPSMIFPGDVVVGGGS